jgi:2'-5' RNA ligase
MGSYRRPVQGCFDFGDRSPRTYQSDSLYFAVLPDAVAAPKIAEAAGQLRRRYDLWSRIRPTGSLHISLAAVGEYEGIPETAIALAKHIGGVVRAAPFKVTFAHASSFKGKDRRPLVLRCREGATELAGLRRLLGSALDGRIPAQSSFVPHVTLMYDRQPIPETDLDEPITWTVRDFVLIHSLVGRSQHKHLARWQLNG